MGSGMTFVRLEAGADITTKRVSRAFGYLSNHWLAELPWPSHIARPTPARESQRASSVQPGIQVEAIRLTHVVQPNLELLVRALARGPNGTISSPKDLCEALAVPRYVYRDVVRKYADGAERADRKPRPGVMRDLLACLVAAGDIRFRERAAREASLLERLGMGTAA